MALYGAAKAPTIPKTSDQSTVAALTDNSGGTANQTLEDVVTVVTGVDGIGSNAASKVDVDARLVSIGNNFADLALKLSDLISHLNDGR